MRYSKPTIRKSRLPIITVLELLAIGMAWDEILSDYPVLEPDDIKSSLRYAVQLAHFRTQLLAVWSFWLMSTPALLTDDLVKDKDSQQNA